jgi:6-phosphogluconolactonase
MSRREGDSAHGEPEIVILADAAAVCAEAARRIVAASLAAVEARGRADIATTGGSTPGGIYRALAASPLRDEMPWDRLHLWFGDDRFVPRHHHDSNLIPVDAVLFGGDGGGGTPLPHENVHPWPVEQAVAAGGDARACASAYEAELRLEIPADDSDRPVFDAVVVGIGPDGHLLSVFPGSAAFDAIGWTTAVAAPTHIGPHVERVTCTPRALDSTPVLLAVALGEPKAEVVARILAGPRDEHSSPGQRARRAGAAWLIDEAAAARLPVGFGPSRTRAND